MAEVPPFLWADAGTFASPVEYAVPGSGEVMPYTATATYANASGQAILPALRIKSADGALLALVFPAGQIADGASAEVTFVPPFGSAASDSEGIRFNTNNLGGYLDVTSGDVDSQGLGIWLLDTSGGGIRIDASTTVLDLFGGTGANLEVASPSFWKVNNGDQIQLQAGPGEGSFPITGTNVGMFGGDSNNQAKVVMAGFDDNGDAAAVIAGIGVIGVRTFRGVHMIIGVGQDFTIVDQGGAPLLKVTNNGTYHIRTGAAWVADL